VLILTLGLRRGEALGLKWEDVDLENGELHIQWQLQRIEGRLVRRQTKTEAQLLGVGTRLQLAEEQARAHGLRQVRL
jgi:integrase